LLLPTASSANLRQAIKSLDEFIDTKESNKNSTKPISKKTASFDVTSLPKKSDESSLNMER